MPNKIKIFFGFMGLIALFSVYSVFNLLSDKSDPVAVISKQISLPEPDVDADHDGLTNQEESYWNTDFQNPDTDNDKFLDGEEVASGHDPLKHGPDDFLLYGPHGAEADKTKNITLALADLVISGIYAGDLKKTATDDTYAKAIDTLTLATIYDGAESLTPDEITSKEIKTTTNLKEVQEQYVNNIFNIMEKNLMTEMLTEPFETSRLLRKYDADNNANNKNIKIYFISKSEHMRQVIQKISALDVPSDWIDLHKVTLSFLKSLKINYDSLAYIEEDPMKAMVAIGQLKNLYSEAQPILASFAMQVKNKKLKTSNNEFLNLIKNLNGL